MYAFHEGAANHAEYQTWLDSALTMDEPLAVCDAVLSGFVRVATNPRIFSPAAPVSGALTFARTLRDDPGAVVIAPGERHWEIFAGLCREANARGNLVSDAYIAAIAIEKGCELISTDRDFARFPSLRWRHPLA